jgi:hypothetical protein
MTYRFDAPQYAGYPSIESVLPVPANLAAIPISPGFIATAEDPVWGPGEFMFGRISAGIRIYGGCMALPVWDVTNRVYTYNFLEWTAVANASRPYYVYQGNRAGLTGEYAWFQMSGRSPVNSTLDIAAGTGAGHNATGQMTAATATFGLDGALVITPSTQTVVTPVISGVAGQNVIYLQNTAGFFVGGYVSGTGVGVAAIVSFVDPFGKYILVTVVNSATVTGNVTITYNNATIFYNVLEMNRLAGGDEA